MKKILFYINSIGHGGAERVIVNLANQFSLKGYNVLMVTSFKSDKEYKLNDNVKRISIFETYVNESFIKRNISLCKSLRRICKHEKPNIIISFMGENNFRAILSTMFLNTKTLISVRNDPNREYPNKMFKFIAKTLYCFANGCVFQTEDARAWFPKIIQRKSKIILNQVSDKFYNLNSEQKKENIVAVGRLEESKNHKLLINAFSVIAKDFPNEKLIIYGDGSLYEDLKNYSIKKGLKDRVVLRGFEDNIENKIKNSKLLVLPSNYEGLPNVVMEAMTIGIPVIATDCPCGGPRMLIEHNKNGILVPVGDSVSLAKELNRLLKDDELRKEISLNARDRAKDFEPSKIFKVWNEYVEEIIGTYEKRIV